MTRSQIKGWTKILLLHAEDIEWVGARHIGNFLLKKIEQVRFSAAMRRERFAFTAGTRMVGRARSCPVEALPDRFLASASSHRLSVVNRRLTVPSRFDD